MTDPRYVTYPQQQPPPPQYVPYGQPQQPQYVPYAQPQQYAVAQPPYAGGAVPYQVAATPAPVYGGAPIAAPVPQPQHHQQHGGGGGLSGSPAPTSRLISNSGNAPSTYRDGKWAIFFLLHLLIISISGIYYSRRAQLSSDVGDDDMNFFQRIAVHAWIIISITFTIGAASALLWLFIARTYAKQLVYIALWAGFAMTAATAVLCILTANIVGAVIFALIAALQAWFIISARRRIAFAAKILRYSIECVERWPATIFAAVFGVLLNIVWIILWIVCALGLTFATLRKSTNPNTNDEQYDTTGLTYLVVFLVLVSFYWTTQVIKNIVHVTVAGVAGSWYFLFPVHNISNPTLGSFKRAVTTSFGSICLGSLVVAVIRALRAMASIARGNANDRRNIGAAICFCILQCLLDILDRIITYINQYAYVQVAVYGKTYIQSARDTWNLFQTRGFDAIINDSIIGTALSFAAFMGGLLTAVLVGFISAVVIGVVTATWIAWAFVGFIIGMSMTLITLEVVDSAVITLFVCLAEDPAALRNTKPEIYNDLVSEIQASYPSVSLTSF